MSTDHPAQQPAEIASEPSAAPAFGGAELLATLRLVLIPDLGPRTYRALIERFGSAERVLSAPVDELVQTRHVGGELAQRIRAASESSAAGEELSLCARHGVRMLQTQDEAYPRLLREIDDPPPLLYVKGELKPADGLAIAMVGARRATHYGTQQAERLAGSLARIGFTIVSGLARGIDAAAHRGALAAGGRTIAVLAGGLAEIYPPEHAKLADEIAAHGALLSEAPLGREPLAHFFPARNRIISGLGQGVVVVEAGLRSGALITARLAGEQGREVFAVPGHIDSLVSQGCHRLIKEGAKLVGSVDDILEELGPLVEATAGPDDQPVRHPGELALNDLQRRVLEQIAADPTSADTIIAKCGLPAGQVLAILTALEMRRLIRRLPGNQYCRL